MKPTPCSPLPAGVPLLQNRGQLLGSLGLEEVVGDCPVLKGWSHKAWPGAETRYDVGSPLYHVQSAHVRERGQFAPSVLSYRPSHVLPPYCAEICFST